MKNVIIAILILLVLGILAKANIFNGKEQITMFGHKEEIDSTQIYVFRCGIGIHLGTPC